MSIAGLTCTASFLVFLQALAVTGAGAVLTLRNTSVLFAQAFAIWGGDFYTFTGLLTAQQGATEVTRFRPRDGSIVPVGQIVGETIVGAGVSTCAPQP